MLMLVLRQCRRNDAQSRLRRFELKSKIEQKEYGWEGCWGGRFRVILSGEELAVADHPPAVPVFH